MGKVYIFGHKKPDTDTVTSAIALSHLKNRLGIDSEPRILGRINKETEFVLKYFNVDVPQYLDDVKIQLKDLNYYKDCYINENDSINETYDYMFKRNITGVPIVDKNNNFKGLLTSKIIGNEIINGNYTRLKTSYANILKVLKGTQVLKFDEEIEGYILAASFRSTTILNTIQFKHDNIVIVGDRHSVIEQAINSAIKLLIIVGNMDVKEEQLNLEIKNKVNIIKTEYDTFHTAKLIGLSNYCKNLLVDMRSISFNENDYYDEFKEKSLKLGYNNYPLIDNNNKCLGLVRITDINEINKKQVILVDHNEMSQSVEGLDEAEILEIIDHHKLGAVTTNMPINFRNMTVGSTNTIIYSLYNESNVVIPYNIAGLMLSGIISDTLKFTSPTTTEYDKYVASRLADIANINIDEYSNKMFKAGTNLKGKTFEQIIDEDIKVYEEKNKKIAISQLITLNSEEILHKKEKYIEEINIIKKNRGYDLLLLCVTDLIKGGSYIFFDNENLELIKSAFNNDNITEGYFIEDCLSRKKQLVPFILKVII